MFPLLPDSLETVKAAQPQNGHFVCFTLSHDLVLLAEFAAQPLAVWPQVENNLVAVRVREARRGAKYLHDLGEQPIRLIRLIAAPIDE